MKVLLLLGILLVLTGSESLADDTSYSSYSPAVYFVAGLLVIDVGVSLGDGIALARDKPNRMNGYFGLATGIVSLALVAVNYAVEDNDGLRNGFAVTMGTAGTASFVLGVMNIRRSRPVDSETTGTSKVTVFPSLSPEREQGYRLRINVNIVF